MLTTQKTIAAAAADDKARLPAAARLPRAERATLVALWERGLAEPTDRFFKFMPRDAFPRSRANGAPGLLPRERLIACPDTTRSGLYVLTRGFESLVLERRGLTREAAWSAGAAAVEHANAEFLLVHCPPTLHETFALPGLRLQAQPNARGTWCWARWGGETEVYGNLDATKAEALAEAEVVATCGGQVAILNSPLRELGEEREVSHAAC